MAFTFKSPRPRTWITTVSTIHVKPQAQFGRQTPGGRLQAENGFAQLSSRVPHSGLTGAEQLHSLLLRRLLFHLFQLLLQHHLLLLLRQLGEQERDL